MEARLFSSSPCSASSSRESYPALRGCSIFQGNQSHDKEEDKEQQSSFKMFQVLKL